VRFGAQTRPATRAQPGERPGIGRRNAIGKVAAPLARRAAGNAGMERRSPNPRRRGHRGSEPQPPDRQHTGPISLAVVEGAPSSAATMDEMSGAGRAPSSPRAAGPRTPRGTAARAHCRRARTAIGFGGRVGLRRRGLNDPTTSTPASAPPILDSEEPAQDVPFQVVAAPPPPMSGPIHERHLDPPTRNPAKAPVHARFAFPGTAGDHGPGG